MSKIVLYILPVLQFSLQVHHWNPGTAGGEQDWLSAATLGWTMGCPET